MAIQEVEKREAQGTVGKKRGINEAAEGMVMDIVQAQQYTKPIPSTVRELTANAVDAQSEKEKAMEILSGKADASKYFIEREGALYADSKWDPTYYDLTHLNEDKNNVELIYKEGQGGGRCDTFIVKDYGVGIGGRRLEGVLEIGFSTKRNRKDALGAFGLGAKVGLATGSDFYTLTTVYNGVKYQIKVLSRKINSTIGALNLETGEQNVPYTFSDGFVIYGEKTDEKNYSMVEVPALKHHKADYIEAVKTQLLYFKNVDFILEDVDGDREYVSFKADTMYNSGNLIISSNSPYSKPHVVIVKGGDDVDNQTGVCYGHIDFKEMELEDLSGDIGIKCPIRQVIEDDDGNEVVINEGVDVVPSREAVRWTPATREFLKSRFGSAQDEATNIIEKQLQQTDILAWLDACKNMTHMSSSNNSVIGRLAKIVEIANLKPKFNGTKIQFDTMSAVFQGFKVVSNTKFLDKKENKYKVNRDDAKGWNSCQIGALYYKTENAKRHTDVYIADQHQGTFTTISPKNDTEIETMASELVKSNRLKFENKKAWCTNVQAKRDQMIKLLEASEHYKNYDDVEVPEDYLKQLTKIETQAEESDKEEITLSAAERRKLEEKVVCNTYEDRYMPYNTSDGQTYQKSKREPKFQEVKDYKGKLFYGFKDDEEKLQFACHILDVHNQGLLENETKATVKAQKFYNNDYRIVVVSQSNKKHFAMHSHINDFFGKPELVKDEDGKVTGCNITMDNAIVHWNTARKIAPYMNELLFMRNFGNFDEEVAKDYVELVKYVKRYNSELGSYGGRFGMDKHYTDFLTFLDKVEKIQEMSEGDASKEDLADYVKEVALPGGITGGLAVNREMLDLLEKLRAYAGPVKELFNHIPLLTDGNAAEMPLSTSMYITEILNWKGVTYATETELEEPEVRESDGADDGGGEREGEESAEPVQKLSDALPA